MVGQKQKATTKENLATRSNFEHVSAPGFIVQKRGATEGVQGAEGVPYLGQKEPAFRKRGEK